MAVLQSALRCSFGASHRAGPWNAALAALAVISTKGSRRATPLQRQKALQQLWCHQASLQTPKHFAQAIHAFGRERRWQEGNCLLEEMNKRTLGPCKYSYTALLSACAGASAWQRAMQLVTDDAGDFEPDLIALSSALNACEKASRWEQAVVLFAEALKRRDRLDLDLVALNTVTSSCGKGFAWAAALSFLDLAVSHFGLSPSVVTYSAAVSACERGQQWQRGLQLLKEAVQGGTRVDAILLGASISACEKGRQWEQALTLLNQAPQWHVLPDTTSFNAAMAALGKSFLWEKALQLLLRVPAPDVVSFDAALDATAQVAQWTQVLDLMTTMKETHSFKPTDFSYMSALTACTAQQQWQRALCLFETLEEDRTPNALLRLAALDALEAANQWEKAVQLLWSSLGSDLALQLGVVRLLLRSGRLGAALEVYGTLEESGMIQPWLCEWELDLHGFSLEVAYVACSYALLRADHRRPLCLVVGRGHGSEQDPVLKTGLSQILPVRGIATVPRNPGRLLISAEALKEFSLGR